MTKITSNHIPQHKEIPLEKRHKARKRKNDVNVMLYVERGKEISQKTSIVLETCMNDLREYCLTTNLPKLAKTLDIPYNSVNEYVNKRRKMPLDRFLKIYVYARAQYPFAFSKTAEYLDKSKYFSSLLPEKILINYDELGKRIHDRRKELKLTQEAVADMANMDVRTYKRYELSEKRQLPKERYSMMLSKAIPLTEALETSITFLFFGQK